MSEVCKYKCFLFVVIVLSHALNQQVVVDNYLAVYFAWQPRYFLT